MKRLMIALGVVTLATAATSCGSKTPTAPSNTVVFTVNLLPSNETPSPITDSESTARGTAVITIHKDTNAIDMNVSVTAFPAGSVLNNAHIHGPSAPTGVSGGVFVPSGIAAASFPALVNGAATFSTTVTTATADQVSQILANPSQFYFNVHSAQHPGGVIRGQLQ